MIITVTVIGAGLVRVTVVSHVRLCRVVERPAGRLTCLVRVEELPNVRMASAAVLRLLLLLRLNSSAHHGRTIRVRDATQKGRGRRELVNQLEHCPILLLLLLKLMLALEFLWMLEFFLFHRRHFRRGKRAKTVGRMSRSWFWMAFRFHLGDEEIRFRAALWRRVGCLYPAVAKITVGLESVATGWNCWLSAVEGIMGHLSRGAGRSVDNRIQFRIGTFLIATRCGRRCGRRRRPAALDLLAPSRSVLVVGVLLQMDHAQSLGLFNVRPSVLWRQTLPFFTCN